MMYPEFVAIYIMLAIVIAMLGAVFAFLFILLKQVKNGAVAKSNGYMPSQAANSQYFGQQYQAQPQEQYQAQGGSVVFCNYCAAQYDSSQAVCPHCGTRR